VTILNRLTREIMAATDAIGGNAPDVWYLSIEEHSELCFELNYPSEAIRIAGVPVYVATNLRGGVWSRHISRSPIAAFFDPGFLGGGK
jgi:ABC-type transport system involved in cytochrome c biogenesis permease subunit